MARLGSLRLLTAGLGGEGQEGERGGLAGWDPVFCMSPLSTQYPLLLGSQPKEQDSGCICPI